MKFIRIIVISLVMIWAFLVLGESMVDQKMHVDEGIYIHRGWTYYKFREPESSLWKSFDAYDQPSLAGHLYGWWLKKESRANLNFFYDFCSRYPACDTGKTNYLFIIYSNGGILQTTVLKTRVLSFLAAWLMLGLLLLISRVIFNRLSFGIVWVALLITNPTFVFEMTRAKPDSLLLFGLVLLIFLIALWLKHRHRFGKNIAPLVPLIFGVLIGLTTSIKLNGMMGFIFLAGVTLEMVRVKKLKATQAIRFLAVTFLTAWVVFVLVNPYTWSSPVKKSIFFFEHLAKETKIAENRFADNYLGNSGERFPKVFSTLMQRQETGLLRFLRTKPILITAILSVALLVFNVFRKKIDFARRSVYLMFLIMGVVTYHYLSLDWWRYYLPLMISMAFAISGFFVEASDKVVWLIRKILKI